MNSDSNGRCCFEASACILFKAFIIGFIVILLSTTMVWFCSDFAYSIHSYLFPELTKHDFILSAYYMIGFMKMIIFFLFLIPCLAIKWSMCCHKKQCSSSS